MAKFRGLTLFTVEVIGTDTLNFKPILDPLFEKNCKGDPHPWWGVVLARLGHFLMRVKI